MMRRGVPAFALAALTLALVPGCSMAPKYVQPDLPVPVSWPVGDAYLAETEAALPVLSYREVFADPRLVRLIELALANNRDLRIAAANIEAARAQYRIQSAAQLPRIDAAAGRTQFDNGTANQNRNQDIDIGNNPSASPSTAGRRYTADLSTTAFEIDLFGRLRSLSDASLNRFFGTEAAARATRLTLIGDIADAWLTHAADASLLKLAEDTAANAREQVKLTRLRLDGGIAPRTDLRQAEQVLATAEADIARQKTALAQDVNALQLLVGAPIDVGLLPQSLGEADDAVRALPAGVDSAILLRRPDVLQAEYELRAANADIGAARAALFPRITLTGLAGLSSNVLSNLFTGAAFNYNAGANVRYSLFAGGAAQAGVAQTEARRDAAVAGYERAIQTAFREVADALARRGTITEQLRADRALVDAAEDTFSLADMRYRGGVESFLASLDAQRAAYQAQRTLLATRLVEASNRVTLYRALGGETAQPATTSPAPER
ncbi:efflux transporter outer membrane subunit [Erythrobacter sp. CCH5-A1]|jgi:multidrug efflux system outer membrane protein|uniref:efflux transporter outer membrane subunit n=1 Tax=Erythrobacter sp. CCH5-A1 TaxID=1768792 RepID=UPI0008361E85|nr:efflux transporter outer membrane subunit [Erythrobacter sp. CCH5-A1]